MNKLYWAKVKADAKVPQKRYEDAGYDLYPCFEEDYMVIEPHETKLVPLGVASAFDSEFVMILKERGSTGTKGIAQRSGVIDSGYRGEYMAPVTNLNTKRVVIKKQDVEYKEDAIIYPYEKAICQGVLLRMPQLENLSGHLANLAYGQINIIFSYTTDRNRCLTIFRNRNFKKLSRSYFTHICHTECIFCLCMLHDFFYLR